MKRKHFRLNVRFGTAAGVTASARMVFDIGQLKARSASQTLHRQANGVTPTQAERGNAFGLAVALQGIE